MSSFIYDFDEQFARLHEARQRMDDVIELLNLGPQLKKEHSELITYRTSLLAEIVCARARIAIEDLLAAPPGTIPATTAAFLAFGETGKTKPSP
jgi:hypothetical protein